MLKFSCLPARLTKPYAPPFPELSHLTARYGTKSTVPREDSPPSVKLKPLTRKGYKDGDGKRDQKPGTPVKNPTSPFDRKGSKQGLSSIKIKAKGVQHGAFVQIVSQYAHVIDGYVDNHGQQYPSQLSTWLATLRRVPESSRTNIKSPHAN